MSKIVTSKYRKGVAAVALSAALAGAFVATGPIGVMNNARAEAVSVTPVQQAGFADRSLLERLSERFFAPANNLPKASAFQPKCCWRLRLCFWVLLSAQVL